MGQSPEMLQQYNSFLVNFTFFCLLFNIAEIKPFG